ITARNESRNATAAMTVVISTGSGFLRGEVYDDTLGLPLPGATVAMPFDGGGPLAPPVTTTGDDRGQFVLAAREGESLVRIGKTGFTEVERAGVTPVGTALTLLDARLTPLDGKTTRVGSALGGSARDSASLVSLELPPGALAVDSDVV